MSDMTDKAREILGAPLGSTTVTVAQAVKAIERALSARLGSGVSDAEVEAAARALCHSDGWHWETRSPERRKSYQRTARAALTAARAAKGEG